VKRSCDGCRAIIFSSVNGPRCDLGYAVDERKKILPKAVSYIWEAFPTEECPKPKTWKEYDNTPKKEKV